MWKMQKHWSNSQNDGQHKISSLADYILWYIHTAVLYNMKHSVNAFVFFSTFFLSHFFLLVLAEALFCCDSVLLFQLFSTIVFVRDAFVCVRLCCVDVDYIRRCFVGVCVCCFSLNISIHSRQRILHKYTAATEAATINIFHHINTHKAIETFIRYTFERV